MQTPRERILILDFGSQYTQLIARRVRELGSYTEITRADISAQDIQKLAPKALILSGGPASVYDAEAPQADESLLTLGIPVLGICYGMQWMARVLGGEVVGDHHREYGPAEIQNEGRHPLLAGTPASQQVWMSHGDRVDKVPNGFAVLARSLGAPVAAMGDPDRGLWALQFHPEVTHTEHGRIILANFLKLTGCCGGWTMEDFVDSAIAEIREKVKKKQVLCAISGGVDSAVMALLLHRAIADQLHCVFVDTGLLRKDEGKLLEDHFAKRFHLPVTMVNAAPQFFTALKGLTDPEAKRKAVGHTFVEVFEEEARAIPDIHFLAQGTIYPDRIESSSTHGPSAVIKSHHNVGGLPERLGLKLVEPLQDLFKDEVRKVGAALGLDPYFLSRHPFPGPGLAVRIPGEVQPERVRVLQEADALFLKAISDAGLYHQISQAFAVLLPVRTVGVMGDLRTYEEVVALRAVVTEDFMTAHPFMFEGSFLQQIAVTIVNQVKGVNRVVYDITPKPPGTIEWE